LTTPNYILTSVDISKQQTDNIVYMTQYSLQTPSNNLYNI